MVFPKPHIQQFHQQRKSDHGIDIAFVDLLMKAFGHQHNTNRYQKRKGQHLQRRMFINEFADSSGKSHHDKDRNDHRYDHDRYVIYQPDRGQNRIE